MLRSLRFPSSFALAVGINLLLLLFVIRLVTGERDRLKSAPEDLTIIDFVQLVRNVEPLQRHRRQELPELVETIAPPPPKEQSREMEPPPEPELRMLTPELAPPLNLTKAPELPAVTSPKQEPPKLPVEAPLAVQQTPVAPAKPAPPAVPATKPGAATSDEPVFDSALEAISKPDPKYPERAKRAGIQGVVTIEFIVTPEGNVSDPRVLKSQPSGVFDEAATQGIMRWKFKPKFVDGKPISRRARLDINFKLKKG